MTKTGEIYKCAICGNVVDVIDGKGVPLMCCGQAMTLEEPKYTENEGNEKHVPIIEKTEVGIVVKVGSVEHPMDENHFIKYIEILRDGKVLERVYLKPGKSPEAEFILNEDEKDSVTAQAYCNLHGLWKSK